MQSRGTRWIAGTATARVTGTERLVVARRNVPTHDDSSAKAWKPNTGVLLPFTVQGAAIKGADFKGNVDSGSADLNRGKNSHRRMFKAHNKDRVAASEYSQQDRPRKS